MKRVLLTFVCIVQFVTYSWAAGDPEAGKTKAAPCGACHGGDGNSTVPEWPKLAGQHENYLIKQLQMFKDNTRINPVMNTQAATLSDQDILDLAAYFSAQTPTQGAADEAHVELGRKIYKGGNMESGVPACMGCHAPNGMGNPAANFPRLAGQQPTYTANQLKAYRDNMRSSVDDAHIKMMSEVASRLTDKEIEAVAHFISGLH